MDFNKLVEYGFMYDNGVYKYSRDICNGELEIIVSIDNNSKISYVVFDKEMNCEYINYKILAFFGEYVNRVRRECDMIIQDIRNRCLIISQKDKVISYVRDRFGVRLEFLWDNDNSTFVFRHNDTKKWFGIVMEINKRKLGISDNDMVSIINVKVLDNGIVDNKGIFFAYHMNKKYWVSILLDGSVKDDTLYKYIDDSFGYTK